MKKLIIFLILLFAWPCFGADQNIYLDNAGAGAGSEADPYGAFSEINWTTGGDNSIFDWVAAADDVYINLKRGVTWNTEQFRFYTSGVSGHPITLRPYGSGSDPVINGSESILGETWTVHAGDIYKATLGVRTITIKAVWFDGGNWGQSVANAGTPAATGEWFFDNATGIVYIYAPGTPSVYYTAVTVPKDEFESGIFAYNQSYVAVENVKVEYVYGDILSSPYFREAGINFDKCTNISVTNCTLDYVRYGVSIGKTTGIGSYATIQNNTITNFYEQGAPWTGVGINSYADHSTISDNTINGLAAMQNGGDMKMGVGIALRGNSTSGGPTDSSIYDNIIYNTAKYGILGFDEDAASGMVTMNLNVYGNYVYDTSVAIDSDGIAFGGTGSGANHAWSHINVYRNTVHDCGYTGIHFADSLGQDSNVWSNLVYNIGSGAAQTVGGIRVRNGCVVYNNTIYNIEDAGGIEVPARWNADVCLIKNNIIHTITEDTSTGYGIEVAVNNEATGCNNDIYNVPVGQETLNFTNTDGITADPKFVDAANDDYHLQSDSPCIDTGTDVSLTRDMDGDRIPCNHGAGYLPDIGADEVPGTEVSYILLDGEDDNYAGLSISGDCDLNNITIARCKSGAMRVNDYQVGKNLAIDDEHYVVSGKTFTVHNSAYQELKSVAEGDGTITDTDCQFSVSDFGFINKSNGDFNLQSTSVLINKGTDVGLGDQTDVDGTDLFGAVEVGSQEYQQLENALWFNNTSGSDSNTSISSSVPLETFDHLSRLGLADGCTIYLSGGQDWTDTFTAPSPGFSGGVITLKSYGNQGPAVLTGDLNFNKEYWEVEGIEFK